MKLVEFFYLDEGAEDATFRDLARRVTNAIMNHVKKNKNSPTYVGLTDDGVAAAFKMTRAEGNAEVKRHLKDLIFFIEGVHSITTSSASYSKGAEGQDLITLFVKCGKDITEEKWQFLVATNIDKIIAQEGWNDTYHEVVHMLDQHRHKDQSYVSQRQYDSDKVRKGDSEELTKYYNTPMEYNAYVQNDLQKISNMVKDSKTFDDAKAKIRTYSEKEFIDKFLKSVGRHMAHYITPKTKRHIIKRASQFWQDLERRFTG